MFRGPPKKKTQWWRGLDQGLYVVSAAALTAAGAYSALPAAKSVSAAPRVLLASLPTADFDWEEAYSDNDLEMLEKLQSLASSPHESYHHDSDADELLRGLSDNISPPKGSSSHSSRSSRSSRSSSSRGSGNSNSRSTRSSSTAGASVKSAAARIPQPVTSNSSTDADSDDQRLYDIS